MPNLRPKELSKEFGTAIASEKATTYLLLSRDTLGVDTAISLDEMQYVFATKVATFADLPDTQVSDGDIVRTLGYAAAHDGGGNLFRYDSGSSATVNDGFVASGPSGVGRFIAIDQSLINLAQWGADPTGATDSTSAIQSAFDYIAASSVALPCIAPPGTYTVTGTLTLPYISSGGEKRWRFAGYGATFDINAAVPCFQNKQAAVAAYTCSYHIEGISILGNSAAGQIGIDIGGNAGCVLKNIATTTVETGIKFSNCLQCTIENCDIVEPKYGIHLTSDTSARRTRATSIKSTRINTQDWQAYAVYIQGADDTWLDDCVLGGYTCKYHVYGTADASAGKVGNIVANRLQTTSQSLVAFCVALDDDKSLVVRDWSPRTDILSLSYSQGRVPYYTAVDATGSGTDTKVSINNVMTDIPRFRAADWDSGPTYSTQYRVNHSGSTWRALQSVPAATTPVEGAYWTEERASDDSWYGASVSDMLWEITGWRTDSYLNNLTQVARWNGGALPVLRTFDGVDENGNKISAVTASVINVRDFGAVGDGVTDDATAIQAAFNATCSSESYIAPVLFPPGRYYIGSKITIPHIERPTSDDDAPPFKVTGHGACLYSDQNITFLEYEPATSTEQNNVVSYFTYNVDGLEFEGNNGASQVGIRIGTGYHTEISNCRFSKLGVGADLRFNLAANVRNCRSRNCETLVRVRSSTWSNSTTAFIENCRAYSVSHTAIPFDIQATKSRLVNCISEGSVCKYHYSVYDGTTLDCCYAECDALEAVRAKASTGNVLTLNNFVLNAGVTNFLDLTPSTTTGGGVVIDNLMIGSTLSGGRIIADLGHPTYAGGTTYAVGDRVSYEGSVYVSIQGSNIGNTPSSSPSWWTNEHGDAPAYNAGTTYAAGDRVTYSSHVYQSKVSSNLGNQPDISPTQWARRDGDAILKHTDSATLGYSAGTQFTVRHTDANSKTALDWLIDVDNWDSGLTPKQFRAEGPRSANGGWVNIGQLYTHDFSDAIDGSGVLQLNPACQSFTLTSTVADDLDDIKIGTRSDNFGPIYMRIVGQNVTIRDTATGGNFELAGNVSFTPASSRGSMHCFINDGAKWYEVSRIEY